LTASWNNTARVWALSGPTPVSTVLAGHIAFVESALFSPDGKRVVTASLDKTARVWDLSGPTPVSTVLAGHTTFVVSASFSPDGKRVVTASWDKTVVIYPVPSSPEMESLARQSLTRCLTIPQREAFGLFVDINHDEIRSSVHAPPC
jgi:WD40 repeat protein